MGGAQSRVENMGSNKLLQRLASPEHISVDDVFWNRLLLFERRPFTLNEDEILYEKCKNLCTMFAANNLKSGNFGSIIRVFLSKSAEVLVAAELDDGTCSLFTHNALLVIRHFLRQLIHKYPESEIIRQLEAQGSSSTKRPDAEPMLAQLIDSLIDIIVHVPVRDATYYLHMETTRTLLTLLSLSQFTVESSSALEVYRLIYQNRQAESFLLTLVSRLISQHKQPEESAGSIILHIADFFGLITPPTDPDHSPLARSSVLLITVLINHCLDGNNVFRNSLSNISDGMNNLFKSICCALDKEETTLVLYYLLHRNTHFRSFVLSRSDIPSLVLPMLRTIYRGSDNNCHHMYMSLIILLILTEDNVFNKKIHTTIIKNIQWYTDRNLTEISLGGLIILVTTRTVQYNLLKMRDEYLHTNCLAALANMSSQFTELHSYVCQRLIGLFEVLAKTYNRANQELVAIERALRIILEVLNSCLSNQLVHNTNLVYTLLYKKDIFETFRNNPAFQDIIHNLDQVMQYFTSKLDLEGESCNDVDKVSAVIVKAAQQWPTHRLQKFPELKFKYVEEEKPEEFFIPYVWSLVTQYSNVYWQTSLFRQH
ncbi:dymeclin isoform X1 [Rhodnius prolixus]|uniref:Dymeclin n=1 Tax=Rhodnius neglectus TaxID=72488 RepID=A0A0P4VV11_9HEMI